MAWYYCWRCKSFNVKDPRHWVCYRCRRELEREAGHVRD